MKTPRTLHGALLGATLTALVACGGGDAPSSAAGPSDASGGPEAPDASGGPEVTDPNEPVVVPLPARFVTDQPQAEPLGILASRDDLTEGQEVVLRGTVADFVEGLAVFTMVEESLDHCAEMGEDDHCATPWDYCCADPTALTRGTVLVEFRDGDRLGTWRVQGVAGLDHLTEVTVAGTVHEDEAGNLSLDASAVHVLDR